MNLQVERQKFLEYLLCYRATRTPLQVVPSSPDPAKAIEEEVARALKEFEATLYEAGVNETGVYVAKRLFAQRLVYTNLVGMFEGRELALSTEALTMDMVQDIFNKREPVRRGHLRLVRE